MVPTFPINNPVGQQEFDRYISPILQGLDEGRYLKIVNLQLIVEDRPTKLVRLCRWLFPCIFIAEDQNFVRVSELLLDTLNANRSLLMGKSKSLYRLQGRWQRKDPNCAQKLEALAAAALTADTAAARREVDEYREKIEGECEQQRQLASTEAFHRYEEARQEASDIKKRALNDANTKIMEAVTYFHNCEENARRSLRSSHVVNEIQKLSTDSEFVCKDGAVVKVNSNFLGDFAEKVRQNQEEDTKVSHSQLKGCEKFSAKAVQSLVYYFYSDGKLDPDCSTVETLSEVFLLARSLQVMDLSSKCMEEISRLLLVSPEETTIAAILKPPFEDALLTDCYVHIWNSRPRESGYVKVDNRKLYAALSSKYNTIKDNSFAAPSEEIRKEDQLSDRLSIYATALSFHADYYMAITKWNPIGVNRGYAPAIANHGMAVYHRKVNESIFDRVIAQELDTKRIRGFEKEEVIRQITNSMSEKENAHCLLEKALKESSLASVRILFVLGKFYASNVVFFDVGKARYYLTEAFRLGCGYSAKALESDTGFSQFYSDKSKEIIKSYRSKS